MDEDFKSYDAMPDRKWVPSKLISMVKRDVIDLNLPGNSFIQMSNFGLHSKVLELLKG